jgi:hypothetical protein
MMFKDGKGCVQDEDYGSSGISIHRFEIFLKDESFSFKTQESLSVVAVNAMMSKLRTQLESNRVIMNETTLWEENSAVVRLSDKTQKYKLNKLWRKRKRKKIAEILTKVVSFALLKMSFLPLSFYTYVGQMLSLFVCFLFF